MKGVYILKLDGGKKKFSDITYSINLYLEVEG